MKFIIGNDKKDEGKKFLHLIENEKFTNKFIKFINKNFDPKEHLFIVIGKGVGATIDSFDNVKVISNNIRGLITILGDMWASKKIFLHGLFNWRIILFLFFQPWLLKKSNWVIWGGDLYYYKYRKNTYKSNLYEFFRKFTIRRVGGLITHVKGDYELAKEWYGARGKYYYSFMYPSNLFNEYDLSKVKKSNKKTYIQVGNSSNPSNNHLEVFDKLKKYKNKNIEIICPLSYGNIEYRDKVIANGNKIFGDKFNPIIEFICFDEYLELLAKIDIAVFNHNRQQALGNITTLLGLGKKVYIRDDITTWQFCIEHELKVYSSNQNLNGFFDKVTIDKRLKNINNVKKHFSEKKLYSDWKSIFLKGGDV
ncbi:TDP-N-acetylfucosamine:lipid II N-acetylfucosaminyltransferase [Clostridium sp.]|uniref:TDP-N-acetylfucosamine:lipid II N-acetylfucosaminyltransferase n=1 Tax=Clostridium sp. TaxID=1506 RepID=UPI003D6C7D12